MRCNLVDQFPIFKNNSNNKFIYLDSAATSQKPQEVIDSMTNFYCNNNASSHGIHSLSQNITNQVEQSRQEVANFLNSEI